MESNNTVLGDDMEESLPETEQTTAEVQDEQPELSAELSETMVDDADTIDSEPEVVDEPEEDDAEPEAEDERPEVSAELPEAMVDDADTIDSEPEEEDAEPEAEDEQAEAPRVRPKTVVTGTVIDTSPTEVLIDLGDDLVGVVASRELERMDRTALESLAAGKEVEAYVLKARGADGRPVLSLARAEEEGNWRLAEQYFQNQEVYFSKVAGYNKGGLIVRFGKVRGFVPASQVSRDRQRRAAGESPEERWGGMVGEDIAVKVVEIDRSRNRLILSERSAAREWRERQKARLLEELEVGEVRRGRVISIADFGAFVDLGGADGLVHLTELSWQHVTHPREVLEVGQEVEVEVISIDRQRKRIGLSMKRQDDDPWQQVLKKYEVAQLVQATVTKLTKFGAFARLVDDPEIEGLIHISELADYRVNHPREVVLVGDVLTLRIVKIDPDQRRLGLSLRQVDSAKYMDQDWQAIADEFEDKNGSEPPTIGDMLNYQPDDTAEGDTEDTDDES
jgi:small subunit ribosomal protein S1